MPPFKIFKRDGLQFTAKDIARRLNVTHECAYKRLRRWERGEWDLERVMKPGAYTPQERAAHNPGFKPKFTVEGLRPRKSLSDIPDPTKYDKKYADVYSGRCSPGTCVNNQDGHRRY